MRYSLRSNGKIEIIDISDESVPFCVQLLGVVERILGQHIEMYMED